MHDAEYAQDLPSTLHHGSVSLNTSFLVVVLACGEITITLSHP